MKNKSELEAFQDEIVCAVFGRLVVFVIMGIIAIVILYCL